MQEPMPNTAGIPRAHSHINSTCIYRHGCMPDPILGSHSQAGSRVGGSQTIAVKGGNIV